MTNQILIGVAITIVAALVVGTAKALRSRFKRSSLRTRTVIEIRPPALLSDRTFKLRYVRDGRDALPERGPIQNRDHSFRQKRGEPGTLIASFKHSAVLGAQFKCFIEDVDLSPSVTEATRSAGWSKPSTDGELLDRVWFLLPNFPADVTTAEGITNNFVTYTGEKRRNRRRRRR